VEAIFEEGAKFRRVLVEGHPSKFEFEQGFQVRGVVCICFEFT